jgi:hypothetical protein
MTDEDRWWLEGLQACLHGKPRQANPYPPYAPGEFEWVDGWLFAAAMLALVQGRSPCARSASARRGSPAVQSVTETA